MMATVKNQHQDNFMFYPQVFPTNLKHNINSKLYKQYLENTPTHFQTAKGEVIVLRQELVKNILVSIKHLTQEFDAMLLFTGREGSGKSLFVRQVLFIFWRFLIEFELINYNYDLSFIHFGIDEMQKDRLDYDMYKEQKYRISDLDESKDDLGRDKFNKSETKDFLDYMRRCREESGVIALLQPRLDEFLPSIVLSRALMVFDVDYDIDEETYDIIRGEYKFYTIPRGKHSYSLLNGKKIPRSKIISILNEHMTKKRFEPLPDSIISFQGAFNGVDPIDKNAYKQKKREKKWERIYKKEEEVRELKTKVRKLHKFKNLFCKLLLFVKTLKVTNKDLGKGLEVSERSVNTYLEEARNNEE